MASRKNYLDDDEKRLIKFIAKANFMYKDIEENGHFSTPKRRMTFLEKIAITFNVEAGYDKYTGK